MDARSGGDDEAYVRDAPERLHVCWSCGRHTATKRDNACLSCARVIKVITTSDVSPFLVTESATGGRLVCLRCRDSLAIGGTRFCGWCLEGTHEEREEERKKREKRARWERRREFVVKVILIPYMLLVAAGGTILLFYLLVFSK